MFKNLKNLLWAVCIACVVVGCSWFDNGDGDEEATPMDDLGSNEVVAAPGEWDKNATENSLGESPLGDFEVLNLNFPTIYFGYDSNALAPSEAAKLDKVAAYINRYDNLYLIIEGHCDQRGTEEYNRALGERRANAIRAYLVKRGVADYKIKTVSYGEDKPAVSGNGESAWKQNRRGVPVPMQIPAR
jgi:peptidoglycan-associated lipoprotein